MRITSVLLLSAAILVGCDTAYTYPDTGPGVDSGSQIDSGPRDSGPDTGPPSEFSLRLLNYITWCTVQVNGAPVADMTSQTLTFAPGTQVQLNATPDATFMWGYWRGTDGDVGAPGFDPNMATMVTMNANKTVQACCPDATGVCSAP
jgi:List-Bact-rpt repeat protein